MQFQQKVILLVFFSYMIEIILVKGNEENVRLNGNVLRHYTSGEVGLYEETGKEKSNSEYLKDDFKKKTDSPLLHRLFGKRNFKQTIRDNNDSTADNFDARADDISMKAEDNSNDVKVKTTSQVTNDFVGNSNEMLSQLDLIKSVDEYPLTINEDTLNNKRSGMDSFNGPLLHTMPGKRGNIGTNGPLLRSMSGTKKKPHNFYNTGPLLHNIPGKRQIKRGFYSNMPLLHSIPGKKNIYNHPLLHNMPGKRLYSKQGMFQMPWNEAKKSPAEHGLDKKALTYINGPLLHTIPGKRYPSYQYGPLLHTMFGKRDSTDEDTLNDLEYDSNEIGVDRWKQAAGGPASMRNVLSDNDRQTTKHIKVSKINILPTVNDASEKMFTNGVTTRQYLRQKRSLMPLEDNSMLFLKDPIEGRYGAPSGVNGRDLMSYKDKSHTSSLLLHRLLNFVGKRVGVPVFFVKGSGIEYYVDNDRPNNMLSVREKPSPRTDSPSEYRPLLHYLGGFGKRSTNDHYTIPFIDI